MTISVKPEQRSCDVQDDVEVDERKHCAHDLRGDHQDGINDAGSDQPKRCSRMVAKLDCHRRRRVGLTDTVNNQVETNGDRVGSVLYHFGSPSFQGHSASASSDELSYERTSPSEDDSVTPLLQPDMMSPARSTQ